MKRKNFCVLFATLTLASCQEAEPREPIGGAVANSDKESQAELAVGAVSYVPEELYIAYGNRVKAVDYDTGVGYEYYHDNAPFAAMASTGGKIFGVAYGQLWKSDPSAPASYAPFGPYGTGWEGTEAMAALNGYLYAIQGGTLWRIKGSDGSVVTFSDYPDGWSGTEAMAATDGYIYAIQGGTLWRISASSGAVAPFSDYPDGWSGTQGMTAKDGRLFVMHDGTLYKIITSAGSVAQLGSAGYYSMFFSLAARLN